jgi:hypothetical protein
MGYEEDPLHGRCPLGATLARLVINPIEAHFIDSARKLPAMMKDSQTT